MQGGKQYRRPHRPARRPLLYRGSKPDAARGSRAAAYPKICPVACGLRSRPRFIAAEPGVAVPLRRMPVSVAVPAVQAEVGEKGGRPHPLPIRPDLLTEAMHARRHRRKCRLSVQCAQQKENGAPFRPINAGKKPGASVSHAGRIKARFDAEIGSGVRSVPAELCASAAMYGALQEFAAQPAFGSSGFPGNRAGASRRRCR